MPFARKLTAGFDVILPDARGHGKSSAPSQGYLYGHHADDVVGLIDQLDLKAPVLIGHSMGGMTSAVVASRLGSALSAVILLDPTFISPKWQREVFESNIAEEHRQTLAMTRSDLFAQARTKNPGRSEEILQSQVDATLRTSIAAFEVLTPPNPDFRELVRAISAPALLVIGDKGVVSLETARDLQSLNRLLQHEMITDGGHGFPYDKPEEVASRIMPFLESLPSLQSTSSLPADLN